MKAEGINHFHGYAKDKDAAARFFKDVIGVEAVTFDFDHLGVRSCVVRTPNSLFVQLPELTDPNGPMARLLESHQEGDIGCEFQGPEP